jgi:glucan biosynthesis protein C
MNKVPNSERIYSLDALRAIMMLLGIVLHASLTFGSHEYGQFWPIKNPENNILFDLIVALIHFFRMPVFFVVAGYFGALLYYKKGAEKMLINRVKRILFPFIGGVAIVYPMAIFSFSYSSAAFAGSASPFNNAWNTIITGKFLPFNVLHLWFLYFLMLFSLMGWILAKIFTKESGFTLFANKIFTSILKKPWLRVATLTVLYFSCLFWIGEPSLTTNNKWEIDLPIFMTYFLFFQTGWIIFKTNSLENLRIYPKRQLGMAIILFFAFIFIPWGDSTDMLVIRELISALFGTLFIFGIIAFFISYFNNHSSLLTYLMQASYWVYIIHLPIVALIPGMINNLNLPVILKYLITINVTIIICFVSYHFAVKSTFLGEFLNGKKHPNS